MAVLLGYNQYWPGVFIVLCSLCTGTPKSSTGCGSNFKVSQKMGAMAYSLIRQTGRSWESNLKDIGLSHTPRRLKNFLWLSWGKINQFCRFGLRFVCWFYDGNISSGFMGGGCFVLLRRLKCFCGIPG